MLQDKADTSVVNIVSNRAESSLELSAQLTERISNLFGQQTEALATLSLEREQGDAILGSRLDNLETMLGSLERRGPLRPPHQKPTIKLPVSLNLLSAQATPPSPIAPAPSTLIFPSKVTGTANAPERHSPIQTMGVSNAERADEAGNELKGYIIEPQSAINISESSNSNTKIATTPQSKQIAYPLPQIEHSVINTSQSVSTPVTATISAAIEPVAHLVSYLQSSLNSQAPNSLTTSSPSTQAPPAISERNLSHTDNRQDSTRCLSCDAPSSNPRPNVSTISGRSMGGGFKFSAISQGVKGYVPYLARNQIYEEIFRRAEIERWEQEALQRDHHF